MTSRQCNLYNTLLKRPETQTKVMPYLLFSYKLNYLYNLKCKHTKLNLTISNVNLKSYKNLNNFFFKLILKSNNHIFFLHSIYTYLYTKVFFKNITNILSYLLSMRNHKLLFVSTNLFLLNTYFSMNEPVFGNKLYTQPLLLKYIDFFMLDIVINLTPYTYNNLRLADKCIILNLGTIFSYCKLFEPSLLFFLKSK